MKKIKIAIQGELGAYSHIAANHLFKESDIKHVQLLRKHLSKPMMMKLIR